MDSCQQAVQAFNMQNAANPDEAMQQEVENLVKGLEYIPPLDVVDFACDHIDPSIYSKKGVILQVFEKCRRTFSDTAQISRKSRYASFNDTCMNPSAASGSMKI